MAAPTTQVAAALKTVAVDVDTGETVIVLNCGEDKQLILVLDNGIALQLRDQLQAKVKSEHEA